MAVKNESQEQNTKQQKDFGGLKNQHVFFVYDGGGLFLEFALQLGRDGHKVYYYTPYYDSELSFKRYALGVGFKQIEKPLYFFKALMKYPKEEVTIMFPDVGNGDMAEFLKKEGYAVFAAGMGDVLENHREFLRKKMQEVGLPVNHYVQITGIDNLKNYLKNHNNVVVKLDIFRNDQESFKVLNYSDAESILNHLTLRLGPLGDEFPFIVEDMIDGDEPGFDVIFNQSDYLKPYLWGFEVSKGPYCGVLSDTMPKPLQEIADKLKPLLKSYDWRCFISTEAIIHDSKPYLIDVCSRAPYPLGVGFTVLYSNFSEIIYKVARGMPVLLKPRGKYMLVLPLETDDSTEVPIWKNLTFPKQYTSLVKKGDNYLTIKFSYTAITNNGEYVGLPRFKNNIIIVSVGNNLKEMSKDMINLVSQIKSNGSSFNIDQESFNKAIQKIEHFNT